MNNKEIERLQDMHRQVFLATTILTSLEECMSKLQNAFLNGDDYAEHKKTIKRLYAETLQLDAEIVEKLDTI